MNLFGIHEQALLFREQRAEVLASNLANVDTPHYLARDMEFKDVLQRSPLSMQSSNKLHMSPELSTPNQVLKYRVPMQDSLDGNTVDGQIEQAKYAENSMQYMATLSFLNARSNALMLAIKGE